MLTNTSRRTCAFLPLWLLPNQFGGLAAGAFFVQFGVQGAWGVVPIYLTELSPVAFRGVFPGLAYVRVYSAWELLGAFSLTWRLVVGIENSNWATWFPPRPHKSRVWPATTSRPRTASRTMERLVPFSSEYAYASFPTAENTCADFRHSPAFPGRRRLDHRLLSHWSRATRLSLRERQGCLRGRRGPGRDRKT